MNEASDHFFANPGFTCQQYRSIGLRHPTRHGKHVAAGRIFGNHALVFGTCRQFVFADIAEQGLRLEWLEQKITGTAAHGINSLFDFSKGGHQHHGQMRQALTDFLQQSDAIHRHHAHVAYHDGERLLGQRRQRRFAPIDGHIGATSQFQRIADRLAQAGIIFHNENR